MSRGKKAMGDGLLEDLLQQEKKLTTKWYARMSGEVPWMEGEKAGFDMVAERLAARIDSRIAELSAE